ncbi:MAG: CDGSH iron-sulfur domain-containing protein [Chloroflexi bacterium]|nr:CDGSH iron-sulfur domain-containing protein [Chloroflexota bacterium]MDA1175102.1 CDGSH iron-sulfur domain-containing protein [Chloroflexota bacterium]
MDEQPQISPTQDGPYRVTGSVPVRDPGNGNLAEGREGFILCRCGGSANKPFCDGTHRRNGFVGEEVADRAPTSTRREVFRAPGITIFDDRSICAHIGNCTDNLAQVFKLGQEPWIDPAGATPEAIANVINTCPSGALSYVLTEDAPADGIGQEPERPQEVTPLKNGPYAVTGGISIVSPDGQTYEERDRCALCRCGGSTNKPFCSGAHWNNGFTADGA